ncbi:hypothetical protein H9P43_000790 [Blastocladiella emersonii ATCC 22665]|nr:hypothetical protein H9P43_000790 [Blastocladiella emersonii ATCC 22665]
MPALASWRTLAIVAATAPIWGTAAVLAIGTGALIATPLAVLGLVFAVGPVYLSTGLALAHDLVTHGVHGALDRARAVMAPVIADWLLRRLVPWPLRWLVAPMWPIVRAPIMAVAEPVLRWFRDAANGPPQPPPPPFAGDAQDAAARAAEPEPLLQNASWAKGHHTSVLVAPRPAVVTPLATPPRDTDAAADADTARDPATTAIADARRSRASTLPSKITATSVHDLTDAEQRRLYSGYGSPLTEAEASRRRAERARVIGRGRGKELAAALATTAANADETYPHPRQRVPRHRRHTVSAMSSSPSRGGATSEPLSLMARFEPAAQWTEPPVAHHHHHHHDADDEHESGDTPRRGVAPVHSPATIVVTDTDAEMAKAHARVGDQEEPPAVMTGTALAAD